MRGHRNLAAVLYDRGSLAEAEHHCEAAVKLEPDLPELHNQLGLIFQKLGKFDQAKKLFQSYRVDSTSFEAFNNLAVTQHDQGQLLDSANSCKQALEIKPDFAEALNNLGLALQKMGRLDEAELSFRDAICLEHDRPEFLINHAVVLNFMNKIKQAEALFFKVSKL